MQPIILVDQDGVFCDFVKGYYDLVQRIDPELHDALYPIGTQTEYYIHEHITDPAIKKRGAAIADRPGLFDQLEPIEGAICGLKYLQKYAADEFGFETLILTAPHISNLDVYTAKAKWIKKHFGEEWLNRLVITRDKTAVSGIILIDDKPQPLGNFNPTWQHVIMPHSYNLARQQTHKVFNGWSKDSVEEIVQFAAKRYLAYV